MKTIVVYYSLEGNTDYVAGLIAKTLGADTLRLYPKKAYPTGGFKKFFWGGKSAVMGESPELEEYVFENEKYDRVIIGFPVWASTFAPPIRTFIRKNDLSGKKIAAFACQGGSGAEKAFEKLKKCLNSESLEETMILIDPKIRPNKENERKIEDFCHALTKQDE